MEAICAQCLAIFVVTHFIIIAIAYRTTAPTQACLEERTLTELNETCPLYGLTRELLISHPGTDD